MRYVTVQKSDEVKKNFLENNGLLLGKKVSDKRCGTCSGLFCLYSQKNDCKKEKGMKGGMRCFSYICGCKLVV